MCGEVMKKGRQISNLDVESVCVDGRCIWDGGYLFDSFLCSLN